MQVADFSSFISHSFSAPKINSISKWWPSYIVKRKCDSVQLQTNQGTIYHPLINLINSKAERERATKAIKLVNSSYYTDEIALTPAYDDLGTERV